MMFYELFMGYTIIFKKVAQKKSFMCQATSQIPG